MSRRSNKRERALCGTISIYAFLWHRKIKSKQARLAHKFYICFQVISSVSLFLRAVCFVLVGGLREVGDSGRAGEWRTLESESRKFVK